MEYKQALLVANKMIIMIFGKRHQGKSTIAFSLAIEAHRRVLVFDPSGNFPLLKVIEVDEIRDWLDAHRIERREVPHAFARVTGNWTPAEVEENFSAFAGQIFQEDVFEHDVSIIVDEAHMLQGPNYVNPDLDRVQRKVPSDSTLIETTHRIVDTDVNTRYHVEKFFFFYADLPREIKKIREDFGMVADEIPKLGKYEVIEWERPQGQAPKWEIWNDPQEWFVELGNKNK